MSTTEEIYRIATANRLLAADMFAELDDEDWLTPSLCEGWTVREVAAHLVPPQKNVTRWALARELIRFRGNLDEMVDVTTRDQARQPTAELVRALRSRATIGLDPPVIGPIGPMVDSAIHLRDAARPLGLDIGPEPRSWLPVLDFLVSRPATRGFLSKDRLDGLRLQVTDLDWTWGEGAEVRGTAEAVAMAVSGRSAALPELDGPGVGVLSRRLSGPR